MTKAEAMTVIQFLYGRRIPIIVASIPTPDLERRSMLLGLSRGLFRLS